MADLTSALGDDLDLTEEDCLFIENHLLMLQMAYTGWKGRNVMAMEQSDEPGHLALAMAEILHREKEKAHQ